MGPNHGFQRVRSEVISIGKLMKSPPLNSDTSLALILVMNVFSWYFPLYIFLTDNLKDVGIGYLESLIVFGSHIIAFLLSAMIGTNMAEKFASRRTLLVIWALLGILSSSFLFVLRSGDLLGISAVAISIGIALGFGLPTCLAYFADSTETENRGRVAGFTFFVALLGMLSIGFLTFVVSFLGSVIIFTAWRAVGLVAFATKKRKIEAQKEIKTNFRAIVSERSLVLYLIPWIMFCLINFFEYPLQQFYWGIEASSIVTTVEFGISSVSALIGGYFADAVGRKRLVISGYVLLGIGYALLSISPIYPIFIGVWTILDGIAWGLFALIFFTVIWGDIARDKMKERYYFLGALPFLISSYVSVIIAPYVETISISASFSLASFFLFLSVLPLIYAPETLPEKEIKKKELKDYIDRAKRVKEKYT
jgi:MFS family permease